MENHRIDYSELGKERIITLADLIREIIRRIWIVLVLAALCAVLLGAYKYRMDSRVAQQGTASAEEIMADTSLSEEEITAVKNVLYVEANADDLQNYIDHSVLMQIDPADESRVILQYRVELAETEEEETLSDLLDSYRSYVDNNVLAAALEESGYELETPYLGELLSFNEKTTEGYSTSSSVAEEVEVDASGRSFVFTVQVLHREQASAEELAALVAEQMEAYSRTLDRQVASHTLTLYDQSFVRTVDNHVNRLTYRNLRINSLNTLRDNIADMEADLSSAQQDLLRQYENLGIETVIGGAATVDTEETEEGLEVGQDKPSVSINRRYVLLGIGIGIVLAVIYIILAYILRGSINSADDIRYLYNLRVLGELKRSGNRTIRIGGTKFSEEQQVDVLLANLMSACRENGVTQLLWVGSGRNTEDSELLDRLREVLASCDVKMDCVTDLPYSAEALGRLAEYRDVILCERIRTSRYVTMEAELRTCMEHGSRVLGTVVIS